MPLALTLLAYARVLRGEFQLDDYPSILANPGIKQPAAYLRRFLATLLQGSGRPVTDLTFALDYAVARVDPLAFHLTNLAIHLAAAGLAFLFTRQVLRLAGARGAAGAAVVVAGLFAVHPLQTEAVSYVVQRAEALGSAFYLAALLLLLRAERRGWGVAGAAAWLAALVAFLLGMGAKVIVATMPVAYLFLTALVPDAQGRASLARPSRRLALLAPFAAIDLLLALRMLRSVEGHHDAGFDVPMGPGASYVLTQWRAVATYLRLLFWPAGQTVDWGIPWSRSLVEPVVLGSGLLLGGLLLAAALVLRRSWRREGPAAAAGRVAAFGVIWFFLVLAPTSSVVPIADALVEHRVYLAAWGILTAATVGVGAALARLPAGRRSRVAALLAGVAWVALAAATWRRNAAWETRIALWSEVVARAPTHQRPHRNLGYAHLERGEYPEAIREYRLALRHGGAVAADDEAFIQNNLALAYLGLGRAAEAEAALRRALEREPGNVHALANLALILYRRNDLAGAEELTQRALATDPGHGGALEVLGGVRMARGDAAGALEPLARAVRENPDEAERWFNLASAQAMLGRQVEACASWQQLWRLPAEPRLREKAAAGMAALGCPRR